MFRKLCLKKFFSFNEKGQALSSFCKEHGIQAFCKIYVSTKLSPWEISVKFCEDLKLPVMPTNQLGLSESLYLLAEINWSCHGSIVHTRLSFHVWHLDLFVLQILWVRKGIRSCQRRWGQVASGHHFSHMRVTDLMTLKVSQGKCKGRENPLSCATLAALLICSFRECVMGEEEQRKAGWATAVVAKMSVWVGLMGEISEEIWDLRRPK